MSQEPVSTEVTSDDKLWALLSYILAPLVSVIVLLIEEKKKRPFIKYHAVQSLVLGAIDIVLYLAIGWTVIGLCVPVLLWFAMVYWGIKAYQGEYVNIPVITNFVKGQNWV